MNGCDLAWRYTRTLMHRGFGLSAELYVKRLNGRSSQWLWPVAIAVAAATTGTTTLNPPASKKNSPSSKLPLLSSTGPFSSSPVTLRRSHTFFLSSCPLALHQTPAINQSRPASALLCYHCTMYRHNNPLRLLSAWFLSPSKQQHSNFLAFTRSEANALPVFGLLRPWNCRRGDMTFRQLHSLRWPQLLARCQFCVMDQQPVVLVAGINITWPPPPILLWPRNHGEWPAFIYISDTDRLRNCRNLLDL